MIGKLKLVLPVLLVMCLASSVSAGNIQTSFEEWFGHPAEAIGGSIFGLSIGTTTGADALFADINAKVPGGYDWYSMTSDNGKVSGDGEYFVSGDVAAYVLDGNMKISFTSGPARQVTLGVSNLFAVSLEAYNAEGVLIDAPNAVATAGPNTKTQPVSSPGTGLQYLTVSSPETISSPSVLIAYVVVRSQPGFYMVDNISAETVPEPGSILALATGLVGLFGVVLRKRNA